MSRRFSNKKGSREPYTPDCLNQTKLQFSRLRSAITPDFDYCECIIFEHLFIFDTIIFRHRFRRIWGAVRSEI